MSIECGHGLLLRKTLAEGTCPLCQQAEIARLPAFVRAWDIYEPMAVQGLWCADERADMLAAREAVGPCS